LFSGEYNYKLDEKGRTPLPPRFRAALKDGVVLTQGVEKCITAYPMAEWQRIASSLPAGSLSRAKIRRLKRAMFANAYIQPIDSQGRISLPASLRDYAEIGDDVVVIGANNCLELWNLEEWAAEKASAQEQVGQIIESLEGQGT